MAKRGPSPRGEFHNKSRVLSTRIREDTRDALVEAAAASGRSLSQEIEYRLRRSFDRDNVIRAECGNRQNYGVLKLLAAVFELAPNEDETWFDDVANFNHVLDATVRILTALRPPGADDEISKTDRWFGGMNAASVAESVIAADASMPPAQAARRYNYIKADLGADAVDRLKALEGSGLSPGERPYKRGKVK
jgi:hypothetical protein